MTERERLQTSIRVRPEIWRRLRALAGDLALAEGGRPSLGRTISHLVEQYDRQHASQPEREASPCAR